MRVDNVYSMPPGAEAQPSSLHSNRTYTEPSICSRICELVKNIVLWLVYVFSFGYLNLFETSEAKQKSPAPTQTDKDQCTTSKSSVPQPKPQPQPAPNPVDNSQKETLVTTPATTPPTPPLTREEQKNSQLNSSTPLPVSSPSPTTQEFPSVEPRTPPFPSQTPNIPEARDPSELFGTVLYGKIVLALGLVRMNPQGFNLYQLAMFGGAIWMLGTHKPEESDHISVTGNPWYRRLSIYLPPSLHRSGKFIYGLMDKMCKFVAENVLLHTDMRTPGVPMGQSLFPVENPSDYTYLVFECKPHTPDEAIAEFIAGGKYPRPGMNINTETLNALFPLSTSSTQFVPSSIDLQTLGHFLYMEILFIALFSRLVEKEFSEVSFEPSKEAPSIGDKYYKMFSVRNISLAQEEFEIVCSILNARLNEAPIPKKFFMFDPNTNSIYAQVELFNRKGLYFVSQGAAQ